jgi:hypothetical protein
MHTHAQKHQRSPWEKSGDLARPSAITARSHEVHSIPRLQQTSGNAQDAAETTAPPIVQEIVSSPGQPLDAGIRAFMEPRFGHDFGEMRVHAGPRAAHAAKSVSAVAYTAGRDIVVGRENVAPDTRQGRELIAHELAHVVQQSGRTPSEPSNLRSTRPDDAAERAAHSAAAAVARGGSFRPQTRTGVALARQMDGGTPAAAPVLAPRDAGSVMVDVEGSGGANGTATVTVGATPAGSGSVTIRGGIQTTPGNAGNLRLRATVGTAVIGRPPGFTVAAFPINWTDTFAAVVNEPHLLGVTIRDGWSYDGSGSVSELDQVGDHRARRRTKPRQPTFHQRRCDVSIGYWNVGFSPWQQSHRRHAYLPQGKHQHGRPQVRVLESRLRTVEPLQLQTYRRDQRDNACVRNDYHPHRMGLCSGPRMEMSDREGRRGAHRRGPGGHGGWRQAESSVHSL